MQGCLVHRSALDTSVTSDKGFHRVQDPREKQYIFLQIFWGLVPGFVSGMLGIVFWVSGIVFWVLGIVSWVPGIVSWVSGIVRPLKKRDQTPI